MAPSGPGRFPAAVHGDSLRLINRNPDVEKRLPSARPQIYGRRQIRKVNPWDVSGHQGSAFPTSWFVDSVLTPGRFSERMIGTRSLAENLSAPVFVVVKVKIGFYLMSDAS